LDEAALLYDESVQTAVTMRAFRNIWKKPKKNNATDPLPMPFYGVWEAVARFSAQIQKSEFMKEMARRRDAHGSHGIMGEIDCAVLYALARWHRPSVVVESGGYLGMSSAFILKALADERLTSAKVYSIEWNKDCAHGILIPDELRNQFIPLSGDVRDLVKGDKVPSKIDVIATCFGNSENSGSGFAMVDCSSHTMFILQRHFPSLSPRLTRMTNTGFSTSTAPRTMNGAVGVTSASRSRKQASLQSQDGRVNR
jgi:hypothetical protein